MGKFFKFIFQAMASLLLVFLFTAAIISLDGSTDQGKQAEVGLVLGHAPVPEKGADPLLDRAVKLYKAGAISYVLVSSTISSHVADAPADMAKYLESHGVPTNLIIIEKSSGTTDGIAHGVAAAMTTRQLTRVLIIADYYRIMRMKMALYHEGLLQIGKAHIGKIQAEDIPAILRETGELYRYVTITYIIPASFKVRKEFEEGTAKVKEDAEKAKKSVDKGLDNLPR